MSKSSEEKAIDKLIAQDSAVFYDNSESLENYGDTKLEIETDSIMIMSDVHAPYYHAGMMAKAIEVARKKKIKTLLLNGDFMDCGTWSSHGGVDSQDWDEELESATNLLEIFRQVFEECYWIKGNHENRFSRQTEFKGQMRHLALQVGVSYDDPWCTVSENDSITINEKWRFVHPSRHYSIIPGMVPFVYIQGLLIDPRKTIIDPQTPQQINLIGLDVKPRQTFTVKLEKVTDLKQETVPAEGPIS